MKMKKFFSGIIAAIMSIAVIAAPVSAAGNDDEPTPTTGKIIINHAAPTGTYTAYPIFVGNVEQEEDDEGKLTGRLVIDTPMFHPNMETALKSADAAPYKKGDVIARLTEESVTNTECRYGLYQYLDGGSSAVLNGKTFSELMKTYDLSTTVPSVLNIGENTTGFTNKSAAETIANLLNLTLSRGGSVEDILGGNNNGAAFYSAFAEAARELMVDKIISYDEEGNKVAAPELADTETGVKTKDNQVTITIKKAGYYLVEYTPGGTDTSYDDQPKKVRRALVLVGLGDDNVATINSKDTENVASIDIQFNETMLVKNETKDGEGNVTDTSYTYNGTEGTWAKNVSASNGDYVNCRVVITLPSNLAAYDQYYLAVPIMYGYNVSGTAVFDGSTKSISRVEDTNNPLKYMKAYFIDNDGKKTQIVKDYTTSYTNPGNLTESASEIFDGNHNASLTIEKTYDYANDKGSNGRDSTDRDDFVAYETFVINDIANMYVRTKNFLDPTSDIYSLKSNYAKPNEGDGWSKFVIEFPVKFDRFDKLGNNIMGAGATSSVDNLGYDSGSPWGDDLLMKNYISARLVYSNNPNLKALKEDEAAYDKTGNPNGVKLYLDTSKKPNTLQNPVGITKNAVSANIVTYRLRVHATTEDLVNIWQAGGLEDIKFAIKNSKGQYAVVEKDDRGRATYDEVTGEKLRDVDDKKPTTSGSVWVYRIVGWADPVEEEIEKADGSKETVKSQPENTTLATYQTAAYSDKGVLYDRSNNSGRFEIVGIGPGDYTVVVLNEAVKTNDYYTGGLPDTGTAKDYKLPREGNKPKTEYRFSFAPELNQDIGKQKYYTHFAPADSTAPSSNPGEPVFVAETMITNYNLKWYDMAGKEITRAEADWWLGERNDVGLMSMRVTYIKQGLTLPVTGGIGTLIFFAVGGALVVISTVAIVTKFRMKRERL